MTTSIFHSWAAAILTVFIAAAGASAQKNHFEQYPEIDVINFGKMNERYYRGGQPDEEDYADLAALGVNTIVDLRNDPTGFSRTATEAAGMKYINIPMTGWKYPKDRDVEYFLSVMEDTTNGTIYVHCKAGKHRTGMTAGVYRLKNDGWSYDQAYREMKRYNYTSWPVHINMKAYVKNYSKRIEKERAALRKAGSMTAARN